MDAWISAIGSASLASVLGIIVWTLWGKLQELRVYYEGDPKDKDKVGKLEAERKSAQAREDELREHYEDELKKEREENKALLREINETLQGLEE